jgi:hypothetical protein
MKSGTVPRVSTLATRATEKAAQEAGKAAPGHHGERPPAARHRDPGRRVLLGLHLRSNDKWQPVQLEFGDRRVHAGMPRDKRQSQDHEKRCRQHSVSAVPTAWSADAHPRRQCHLVHRQRAWGGSVLSAFGVPKKPGSHREKENTECIHGRLRNLRFALEAFDGLHAPTAA